MKHLMHLLAAVVALTLVTPANAQWTFESNVDPITDENRSFAWQRGNDNKMTMAIKCEYDGVNLLLTHGYMVGENSYVLVEYRIDRNEAVPPTRWFLNTGNKMSYAPMSKVPVMAEAMRKGQSMYIRATDIFDGERVGDTMSLMGFSTAYDRMVRTCKMTTGEKP